MMNVRRLLAGALAAALLCPAMTAAPAAAAAPSAFVDVTDPQVGEAAELLRLLGIVNGTGEGYFTPGGTLTRAEFCKLAIEAMGLGGEAAAQSSRTIFLDVKGDHWARGYINLAASTAIGGEGGDKLMVGKGDGTFGPYDVVTFSQAVTILMRVLGYSAKDVASGSTWYDGYLATAASIGLTQGVALKHSDTVTRGQAALLFKNMLFLPANGGEEPYLTALGGQVLPEGVLVSLDAAAVDGTDGGVQVITGAESAVYKTDHAPFDPTLLGSRVSLALDKSKKVVAILPAEGGKQRTVTVSEAEAGWLSTSQGERIILTAETPVYKNGEAKTWKDVYLDLKSGSTVTVFYNPSGKLAYLFLVGEGSDQAAAVAYTTGGNPFRALTGEESSFRVVKNGGEAALGDIRQYDAATWDSRSKTLYVSDLRLTGIYEAVAPSPVCPTSVTVMGATLSVLPCAYEALEGFKLGDRVTFLLTSEGKVAGAVSPEKAGSTTVGVVVETGESFAKVKPMMDIRGADGQEVYLQGDVKWGSQVALEMMGRVVTVSSARIGSITVSPLKASGAAADLNVAERTLGSKKLADGVFLYERAGTGAGAEISLSQLTQKTVKAEDISYVGTDYAGRVNILVLSDVTGDLYTYGVARCRETQGSSGIQGTTYYYSTVSVEHGEGALTPACVDGGRLGKEGELAGVIVTSEEVDGGRRLGGYVKLQSASGVRRSAFNLYEDWTGEETAPMGTVTVSGKIYPIAGNVVCYHRTSRRWFKDLQEARTYAAELTVCFDRAPEEGGKIRMVIVE